MSIYKPNGFYPYLQEVDLENLNGNTFSCQVNTDGAMCAGGKIKMYLPDDNTVLYDNLYQFQTEDSNGNIIRTPIPNGGMAEFKIEPYQINVNFNSSDTQFIDNGSSIGQLKIDNMNFIYLTPNDSYGVRRTYCPYNLFNVNIEKYVYNLILRYKDEQYDEKFIIPIKNINIQKISSFFSIILSNLQLQNFYNFIVNTLGLSLTTSNKEQILSNLMCYVTLKNDTNYLWEVELFEHYFNDDFNNSTFISDGYITGSTQNVLWYDSINQNIEVKNNEKNIAVDNYIEIEANSQNSDLFKEELLNGYTDMGKLDIAQQNESTLSIDSNNFNKDDYYAIFFNNNMYYTPKTMYEDKIMLDHKFILDEQSQTFITKTIDDIDFFIGSPNTHSYVSHTQIKFNFQGEPWKILKNCKIEYDDVNNKFNLNTQSSFITEDCYRLFDSTDTKMYPNRSFLNEAYEYNPFAVNSWTPIVIVTNYFGESLPNQTYTQEQIDEFSIFIGSEQSRDSEKIYYKGLYKDTTNNLIYNREYVNADGTLKDNAIPRDEILITLNEQFYRAKILFPLPFNLRYFRISLTAPYYIRYNVSTYTKFLHNINSQTVFNDMIYCYINGCYNSICIKDVNNTEIDSILYLYYYFGQHTDHSLDLFNGSIPYSNLLPIVEYTSNKNWGFGDRGNFIFNVACNNVFQMDISFNIRRKSNYAYDYCTCYIDIIDLNQSNKKMSITTINCANASQNNDTSFSFVSDEIALNDFKTPILQIDFYGANQYIIKNLQINRYNKIQAQYYPLKLVENSINIINKNNMYLFITNEQLNNIIDPTDVQKTLQNIINKSYSINQYNLLNNSLTLDNKEVNQLLYNDILNNVSSYNNYQYEIRYKKRQPISWVTHNLGFQNNYSKIELKEAMDVNLHDGEGVKLYATNNETSYNSFYGVKDTNLNVDNIYVRFPGYTGYDAMNNQILDNKDYYTSGSQGKATYPKVYNSSGKIISDTNNGIKGWFYSDIDAYSNASASSKITWSTDIVQNINLYGKQVRATAFDPIYDGKILTSYCKLFKITSYNYETGEIVFAGGLERKILDTDKYEIWKADVIEGSSNKYDITEVVKSYTRLYPAAEDIDETAISCNSPLITEPIKIVNSTPNKLFIQPNINFYTNEYNKAYLYFPQFSEKSDVNYSYITKNNYNFYETSIEKLDNSQWLIYLSQPLSFMPYPGYIYNLYMDTVKSIPANYFYARTTPDIDVKIGDYQTIKSQLLDNNFIYNLDGYKKNLSSLTKIDDASTVNFIDVCFLTSYENCNTPIKRYRYKIYDSNMNLILDTDYIYDNLLMCNIRGLLNQQFYYLEFECENQDNKVDTYSQLFKSIYNTIDSTNIVLELNNKDEYNCVSISLKYKNTNGLRDCTKSDFSNYNSVSLYKRKKTDTYLQWVCDIDVKNNFTNIIYDYNINNNVEYEYILIMINSSNIYYQSANSIFVKYDDWSMVDIIEDNDIYITDGDVWKFKYNLESSDIPVNNSVTLYDTLSKYPQFGYGKKSYASSGLSCLLGDVGVHYQQTACGIKEKDGYYETDINDLSSNNIAKYLKWKKFVGNNNMKLLKDIKGNKWIVRINEKPSVKNNDSSQEQLYTISFEWSEVMDSNNISIISVPKNN